ncbi:hypothetical protein [Microbacterium sp. SORGH_AS_0888]|uniref:hypothetical protein n=1 Tax=Microbacterium sp. SORGH_AS_0888 TaxID=3041791 RepID=UPI0027D83125|nr:hypothetical protein [Microbacterium sp. SORGH_AS_0888]
MTSANYAPLTTSPTNNPQATDLSSRLAAFAQANGAEFYPVAMTQPLPGVIFRDAKGRPRPSQAAGNIVRFPGPPLVEVANAMYAVPLHITVLTRVTRAWGYAAMQLPAPRPWLLVESARAQAVQGLPVPKGLQPVTLGGSHGRFEVYAPGAAGTVAEALLTREVLDALDDDASPALDLEVSEGWVFLYAPGRLATTDPTLWQRLFGVLDLLRTHPALGA